MKCLFRDDNIAKAFLFVMDSCFSFNFLSFAAQNIVDILPLNKVVSQIAVGL